MSVRNVSELVRWPQYFKLKSVKKFVPQTVYEKQVFKKYAVNEALNSKIILYQGDATKLNIDAIVNAANADLRAGGGICGAIHRAAGSELEQECKKIGHTPTGQTALTKGYKLPCKYVLHTVGPIGEKPDALASCYKTCLDTMKENCLRSIAFCCISTGIYGYPNESAARTALQTVREWLETNDNAFFIDSIVFCLFLEKDVDIYNQYTQLAFPLDSSDNSNKKNDKDTIDGGAGESQQDGDAKESASKKQKL